ncbi:MAG: fructose-6-phosphate aldolase [Persicimonas sp.]
MKIFIDSADVDEIREAASLGLVDGVTTNPSLVAKSGRRFKDVIEEICDLVDGPVSAEVTGLEADEMVDEGTRFAAWADNVIIKVPLTREGLKACKRLSSDGIGVNVTLCFSANQALLAAKAGATFISPFIGRLDDIGHPGMQLIEDICEIYEHYPQLDTEVLVASVRHPRHVTEAAKLGADVATIPFPVLDKMLEHPKTDLGLEKFLADWQNAKQ